MSGGRCKRRKMMGRGAEGGCGTEEKPCPVSRVSLPHPPSPATASAIEEETEEVVVAGRDGVDCYAQARKALAERSPFDSEEAAARVTTLPVNLAVALARRGDGRRKHKKVVTVEHGKKAKVVAPPPAPVVRNVWTETEEYFRDVTLGDIDRLVPKLPSLQDPCLLITVLPGDRLSGKVEEEKLSTIPTVTVGGVLEPVMEETELSAANEGSHVVEAVAAAVEKEAGAAMEAGALSEGDEDSHDMMDIDEEDVDHGNSDVDVVQEKGEGGEDAFSLNWVMSSKHRAILTSERPNKKRKLLGSDAGLERLLKLPHLEHEDSPMCDYCCSHGNISSLNQLLCCDSCKVSVHQKCYGINDAPGGAWLCTWCKHLATAGKPSNRDDPCLLCPKKGGALKPVGEDGCINKENLNFAHLFCSLWMPEVYVNNVESMEPILNVEGIQEIRKKLVCHVCKVKHGPCVRCSHGTCRASFHPICARESNHRMEIWGKAGCNNVELRVFCSKHSMLQDITSTQHVENIAVNTDNCSLEDNCLRMRSSVNKITELRLTRSKTIFEPNTDVISDVIVKNEKPLEQDTLEVKLVQNGADAKLNENMQTIDLENDNAFTDDPSIYPKFMCILKKLIEKGKIKINDVALQISISADSLEAAIAGEPDALPLNKVLKLARWLKDSVYMAAPMVLPKTRTGYSASKIAGNNIADALSEGQCGLNAAHDSTLGKCDAVNVESLLTHRGMDSNKRKLNDTEMACPLGNSFTQRLDNRNSFDNINANSQSPHEDTKKLGSMRSTFVNEDCSKQKEDTAKVIGDGSEYAGTFLEKLPEYQGVDQGSEGTVEMVSARHADDGGLVSDTPDIKVMELSNSYMSPFIEKRLMEINSAVSGEEIKSDGYCAIAANSCKKQARHLTSVPVKNELELPKLKYSVEMKEIKLEGLAKAEAMGILEFSPEDELEGEILHLQNKLLDAVVAMKHHHECLMSKVASSIPKELDAMKQQRWDSLLVNRFLREVREAKKRGRKERRHREAQAILAAATAAAASSRVSSLRKETNDEAGCTNQEGHVKVEAVSGDRCPLQEQAKEKPLKLSVSKLSHGKNCDVSVLSCDICKRDETLMNPIFVCGGCKVAVHLDCYRRCKDPISSWYCEPCEEQRSQSRSPRSTWESRGFPTLVPQCGLCGTTGGAFRKSTDGQWVHAFCAEWMLVLTFRRGQEHIVDGMDTISKTKDILECCICHQKIGVCIKCGYGHCQIAFHPICARSAGLYMNVKTISGHRQHKAYCQKHSQEQRDKADKPGAEEFRSIRQTRVELEKLRLLCERIIRREKLKRELVLCSHGILSSRREYAAFSMLVRSRTLQAGVSSESATTSINNTSYSETVERSDDITVDSTASGKRKIVLPSSINGDRGSSQRSRTHLPLAQKVTDRTVFAGKQLPWRPTSVASDTTDEERKPKSRKRTESFQKELVMTSDQASMQNQRLPKGFVYVPMDSLPKPQDIQSHEPHLPDG